MSISCIGVRKVASQASMRERKSQAPKGHIGMRGRARFIPHAVVFVSSMGVMIVELVAGRLVAKYLGNSLYTWTSVIGIVLGGISVGNWVGGRLADKVAPRRIIPMVLLAASVLTALIVGLDIAMGLLTRLLDASGISIGILVRAVVLIAVLFFLPSAALGMVSPVMAKYAIEEAAGVGKAVGGIYAVGSLGSIGGTFLAGYVLIPAFGLTANILAVGLVLAALSLLMGGRRLARGARIAGSAWLLVLLLLLVTGAPQRLSERLGEAQAPGARLVYEKDSAYSYIQVVDRKSERTLRLDALIHNKYDPSSPDTLLYQYERMFAALTESHARQTRSKGEFSALTLGGGAFTLPAYLERHYPAARQTVVEIDPEVVRTAHRCFDLPRDAMIRITVEDARRYVQEAQGRMRFDLVYSDAFNAYSVPAHLTTREFARQLAGILSPDGVLLANVIDILDLGKFLGAYLATLQSVFPQTAVYMPAESSSGQRTTFVIAASRGWRPPGTLRDDSGAIVGVEAPPQAIAALAARAEVLSDDHAPVENLMAPVFLHSVK
jgi:spermidine synthase